VAKADLEFVILLPWLPESFNLYETKMDKLQNRKKEGQRERKEGKKKEKNTPQLYLETTKPPYQSLIELLAKKINKNEDDQRALIGSNIHLQNSFPMSTEWPFFSNVHLTVTKIELPLGHKTNLTKF
jgi:CHAT domain-containing protein